MTRRTLLAGLVGGVLLFIWGFIAHVVLPLGEAGIQELPNEDVVLTPLRENIAESGFYFFPGMMESPGMTKEEQQAARQRWEERYRTGPHGILIYHPQGQEPFSPRQLLTELLSNIAAALLVAFLLSQALGGFGARVLFVMLVGLVTGLEVDLSYWNWFGFPTDYTVAVVADHVIGWGLAGLALAAMLKPPAA